MGDAATVSTIGERLKEEMSRRGLNQTQLAKQLDVGQPNVSKWIRGESEPPADKLSVIEAWLAGDNESSGSEDSHATPSAEAVSKYRDGFYRLSLVEDCPLASFPIRCVKTRNIRNSETTWGMITVHRKHFSFQQECRDDNEKGCDAKWWPELPTRPGYRFDEDWPELHTRYVNSHICPKCGSGGRRVKRGDQPVKQAIAQVFYLTAEERAQIEVDLDPGKKPEEVFDTIANRKVSAGFRNRPRVYVTRDKYKRKTVTPLRDYLRIEYLGANIEGSAAEPDSAAIDDRMRRILSVQSKMAELAEDLASADAPEDRKAIQTKLDDLQRQLGAIASGNAS